MSAKLKLKALGGGSLSFKVEDTLATDEEQTLYAVGDNGKVLSGTELTAVGIIGTAPYATLWKDGSITGGSSNGTFTKHINGDLTCSRINVTFTYLDTPTNWFGSTSGTTPRSGTSITFPIAFNGINPVVTLSCTEYGMSATQARSISLTSFSFQVVYSAGASPKGQFTANGRWK